MLGTPEPLLDARHAILEQYRKGDLAAAAAADQLLAADPESAVGWHLLAKSRKESGDVAGAEEALWKSLAAGPSETAPYFTLSNLRLEAGDKRGAIPFRLVALWTVATSDEVPDGLAALFEKLGDQIAHSPEAYAAVAEAVQSEMGDTPWPEPLVPYRLLCDIRRQSEAGLDPDLLREILDRLPACTPVFRAALREWMDGAETAVSDETAALLLALLGESENAAFLDDLLDDQQYPTTEALFHGQWAVRRIAQRHSAEAFERLQAAVPRADATTRCFVAEQIYFLPAEITGRKEAILRVLDDLPASEDPENDAHLLLTVSTFLAMLGSPADSRAVLEKRRRRLPKEGREWLDDVLSADHDWLPILSSQGIDELSIEDLCIDLALIEEPGEDDHDDEDDEDDFGEPALAEPRPGRNDPCWCGSGKKYKKCHLEADDEERRAGASSSVAEFREVLNDIMETAVKKLNRADTATAHRLFFDCDPGMIDIDPEAQGAFFQWLTLDYRPESSGMTAIEQYLRRRGARLPESERALVNSFRDARYALWEVQRIEKGRGVEVKDRFAGDSIFIHDVSTSRQCAKWDCIVAYAIERNGRWEFFADGLRIPRNLLPRIVEMVETGARESGLAAAAYFRSRSHEWRRVAQQAGREWAGALKVTTAEGDDVEFSTAVYEVSDPAAAESALLDSKLFQAGGSGDLVWMEAGRESGARIFGHVEIAGGRLKLECSSRQRLELGRQLVEKHAGRYLRHVEDTFHSLDQVRRDALERPARDRAPQAGGIPPEVERELVLELKAKHYATWPDTPLPALGGRTPRQEVRSASGRRAVEELLRDLENGEERQRQAGRPAFDVAILRKDLGL